MTRKRGLMSMDLFHKIADEAISIPIVNAIVITGLGEPLQDKFLFDRIEYIRQRSPGIGIELVTNGQLLTPQKIDALRDAGLTKMSVSLNAVTRERRIAIMKLDDFDHVVAMCDYAIAHGRPMNVIVKAVCGPDLMNGAELTAFQARWGVNAFLHSEGNWAGETWMPRTPPHQACSRPSTQIMVLHDGRVSLCCFDGEGKEILGDLNTQSIREVFNGTRATDIRIAHRDGRRHEIEVCKHCTAI
jgi:radical SAM protein with 4Fe4S-binding SPASM domain